MVNPFSNPGTASPLSPWENPEHERFYADIDSAEKSFNQFCADIANADLPAVGETFLTVGMEGCGKTALINRGTHHALNTLAKRQGQPPVIVNLANDWQPGTATDRKIRSECGLLAETLFNDEVIAKPDFDYLSARLDEPATFGTGLESLLKRNNRSLILILPRIELPKELDSIVYIWRRKRILTFLESHDQEVAEYCQKTYGVTSARPVHRLEVGPLRSQDGWTFVEVRMRETRALYPEEPIPGIAENVLHQFMEERQAGGSVTSIRELHVACQKVFDRAINMNHAEISIHDFAFHYLRLGKM